MAKSRSFKEYVTNRFYNEFYKAISAFIEENKDSLNLRLYKVRTIDNIELDDIDVKFVDICDQPKMAISFDVGIEAEILVSEDDRHNERSDEVKQWFMLSCSGDLDNNLDDLLINNVCEYSTKNKITKPMSDSLSPIIYPNQLEVVAKDFLERYYQEALYSPMYVNPAILAERIGLTVEQRQVTEDCSVFGQIFFADCEAEYYDNESCSIKTTPTKARTVIVDPNVFFLRNLGAFNNTIVHECVHWDKHKKVFALERLYNENATRLKCQVVGGIKDYTSKKDADYMEWQANALAPRIQMPFTQAKAKANEIIREYLKRFPGSQLIDIMEQVIDEMSLFFGVSRMAAKIRMVDLGYEEAIGTFTCIDGRYVKSHTYKKGAIEKNQTFSISAQDAVIQGTFNLKLREKIESGNYIYVDSHYCINDPKYITADSDGNTCLTDYARYHADECCLVFDLKVHKGNNYANEYYTECVLYRDASSAITFEASFSDSKVNVDVDAQAKAIKAFNQEMSKVLQEMPGGFSGSLKYLMNWRKKTVEKLAEECSLDTRTIQRMRNDEDYDTTIESIVAMCVALKLPPMISKPFIDRSSFSIGSGEKAMALQFVLNGCYTKTIYECNALLIQIGYQPLTKEK